MSEPIKARKIIRVDDSVAAFVVEHDTLVCGNNALALGRLEKPEPLVVGLEDNVIDFEGKRQQLTDNIHAAARQLKMHYDKVANDDAGFIPYWQSDVTFAAAANEFSQITKRKMFESYRRFMVRNELQERLSLDAKLEHFASFYDNNGRELSYGKIPGSEEGAIKAVKYNIWLDFHSTPKYLVSTMTVVLIVIGHIFSIDLASTGLGLATCAGALAGAASGSNYERSDFAKAFTKSVHEPMQRKAEYADRLVTMIHKYAA